MEAPQRDTRCPAITVKGERCKKHIETGSDFCSQHDPRHAERRRQTATKAGHFASGPAKEAAKIRRRYVALIEEAKAGTLKPQVAYAVSALGHVALSALRVEVDAIELETVVRRLDRVEEDLRDQGL